MDSNGPGPERTYRIMKSDELGFGFVAGHEFPTIVKAVEPKGPSYKRLLPGDIIMAVNGRNVEGMTRQQIIEFILKCQVEIKITVRQPSYEELIRAQNLSDPRFYTLNRSQTLSDNRDNLKSRPLNPPSDSPLNRLVTSIAQQQQQPFSNSPYTPGLEDTTPPVQINTCPKPTNNQLPFNSNGFAKFTKGISNNINIDNINSGSNTIGRNLANYGRHSPLPQRCKSSMDTNRKSGKKNSDSSNDQPLLKRSNTMRPIKPPPKVLEIFEVVIKIFFEDGQTKVLKYNQNTIVRDILETLNGRITSNSSYSNQIKKYFGLALTVGPTSETGPKESHPKRKMLHILEQDYSIMKIRQLPYATRLRLLYRMIHPPSDVRELFMQDKVAFDYLYQQSCNDLKLERFTPELDSETALKLSALYILEYVRTNYSKLHQNSKDPKVYIDLIKKTPGLQHFVPISMVENIIDKKGKKIIKKQYDKLRAKLVEQLKSNFEEFDFEPPKVKSTTNLNCYSATSFHELSVPEMQASPSDIIKLLFLNYLSQLPCYAGFKKQNKNASPIERTSAGDCSSSLESVPRTSDSSPLIRQEKSTPNGTNPTYGRIDYPTNMNTISRMAQMNSMRSLNNIQNPISLPPMDQPDMAQTPSMESISSITFNMQGSPSPQQPLSIGSQQNICFPQVATSQMIVEPSPMPRQIHTAKATDYNTIEKIYGQRYKYDSRSIEEILKKVISPPPPPPSNMFNELPYQIVSEQIGMHQARSLTRVLTDKDLEKLRCPPLRRMIN